MKKICIVLLAMVFTIGMVMTAQAANVVNCKTTSEAIQKVGCEKAGSMSFSFDAGSIITEGDWWYADLPVGVEICKKIDYEITNGAVNANFGLAGGFQRPAADGGQLALGNTVIVIKDLGATVGANGIIGTVNGVKFRVQGSIGLSRVLITAIDTEDAVAGTSWITVEGDAQFMIKLLDGNQNPAYMWKDNPATPAIIYNIALDLPVTASVDNTFCINAENLAGNYVNVSYDSMLDKFNFTGDNEVAHVMAANAIICESCKGATTGFVPIATEQGVVCAFDYDVVAVAPAVGYCTPFIGNEFIISAVNPFDDGEYSLVMTITSPATGVYWAGGASAIWGNAGADLTCPNAGGTALWGGGFSGFLADGITAITTGFPSNNCTTPVSTSMARVLKTTATQTITSGNAYTKIEISNLPRFVYDSSVVLSGQVVTVKIELIKEPCGKIFECSRDIATFIDSCGAAVGVGMGNLVMPYFPPMDSASSAGWWAGFALYNNTASDGIATVTVYEQDGDSGTYDADVPAYGLFITLNDDLLALLDPATGNTGDLGDDQCYIYVETDWATGTASLDQAGAFFMMGDGTQAQGGSVEANY